MANRTREVPEGVRQQIERVEGERKRLEEERAGKHFIVTFGKYLMDPDPLYGVVEVDSSRARSVHAEGLSEAQARALADQLETQYPNGTPPGYWWERLPEANKRSVLEILSREAVRIAEMHLYLADLRRQRKVKLPPIEAEALALDTKHLRYTITAAEAKRLTELTQQWPEWRGGDPVAPVSVRQPRRQSQVERLRAENEQLRAELEELRKNQT